MSTQRTEAQRQAARENGAKSQGPKTDEGKAKSRENALKHGMTGEGVVVPPNLRAELVIAHDKLVKELRPETYFEECLVEKAALGRARSIALTRAATAEHEIRAREAVPRWDIDQAKRTHEHVKTLRYSNSPGVVDIARKELLFTTAGCKALAQLWYELEEKLSDQKASSYD